MELQVQNEELRAAQQKLEESQRRYADLYDFAPLGYFTFDKNGLIREVNVTGAKLLGAERRLLLNKPFSVFLHPEDMEIFFLHRTTVLRSKTRQTCDVRLKREDGSLFHVHLESVAVEDINGTADFCRTALIDITAQMNYEKMLRESEERYRSLVEVSPLAIAVHRKGRYVYMNSAGLRLYGAHKLEDILGKEVLDFVHPDYRQVIKERIQGVEEQRIQTSPKEATILRLDGQAVDIEATATPITFHGKPAVQVIIRDMTEHKAREQELKDARDAAVRERRRLEAILNTIPSGVLVSEGPDFRITLQNREATSMGGLESAPDLLAEQRIQKFGLCRPDGEPFPPDDLPGVRAFQKGEIVHDVEMMAVKSDGQNIVMAVNAAPFRDETGKIVGSVVAFNDITKRKQAETELQRAHDELEKRVQERTEELSKTNELLATMFSSIDILMAYMDKDFNFVRVNRAYAENAGRDPDFFVGRNYFDLYPSKENEESLRRVVEKGDPYFAYERPFEYYGQPNRGVTYWDWSLQPVKDGDGNVSGVMLGLINVTDRRLAEEVRIRLEAAVESAADAIVITSSRGEIQYVNPAFERITGYARMEAVGQDLHLLDSGKHTEEFFAEIRRTIRQDDVWRGHLINKKKDGTLYHEECTYSPVRNQSGDIINYISIKRDVTEKLRLESVAEAVNTMNNIGYIFSGVRHEIGNPISSLLMTMSLLRKKVDTGTKEMIKDYVNQAMSQVEKVEYLLKSLKNFNMYENVELQDIEVRPFLDKFLSLVSDDMKDKKISVEVDVAPDARRMYADPRALQQVLLNVLTNSADALSERENPRISIGVSGPAGGIQIKIEDNGAGMTEEELKKVFKPFYTTKSSGTGLGMVIVKKMLAKMNATIEVTSRKNLGTTVEISIPGDMKK